MYNECFVIIGIALLLLCRKFLSPSSASFHSFSYIISHYYIMHASIQMPAGEENEGCEYTIIGLRSEKEIFLTFHQNIGEC